MKIIPRSQNNRRLLTAIVACISIGALQANPPSAPAPVIHGVNEGSALSNVRVFENVSQYQDAALGNKVLRFVAAASYDSRVKNGDVAADDFDQSAFDVTGGLEWGPSEALKIGIVGHYINTETDTGHLGNFDLDGWGFSAYGRLQGKVFRANLAYSRSEFDEYPLKVSGLGSKVLAMTESTNQQVTLDSGLDLNFGNLVTGPTFGFRYLHSELASYSGPDTDGNAFRADTQDYYSFIPWIGWQGTFHAPTQFGRISPYARVAYETELSDELRLGAPSGVDLKNGIRSLVTSNNNSEDEDWIRVGAGVEVASDGAWAVGLGWEGYFGIDSASNQHFWTVNGGVKF